MTLLRLIDLSGGNRNCLLLCTCLKLEFFEGYKQAHRKEDDIAIVNAGMRVKLSEKGEVSKVI